LPRALAALTFALLSSAAPEADALAPARRGAEGVANRLLNARGRDAREGVPLPSASGKVLTSELRSPGGVGSFSIWLATAFGVTAFGATALGATAFGATALGAAATLNTSIGAVAEGVSA
jgi:hypothetical protein